MVSDSSPMLLASTLIIAREGSRAGNPELLQQIKQAVMEAVSKFVKVAP